MTRIWRIGTDLELQGQAHTLFRSNAERVERGEILSIANKLKS
jgi:hypothetical protein